MTLKFNCFLITHDLPLSLVSFISCLRSLFLLRLMDFSRSFYKAPTGVIVLLRLTIQENIEDYQTYDRNKIVSNYQKLILLLVKLEFKEVELDVENSMQKRTEEVQGNVRRLRHKEIILINSDKVFSDIFKILDFHPKFRQVSSLSFLILKFHIDLTSARSPRNTKINQLIIQSFSFSFLFRANKTLRHTSSKTVLKQFVSLFRLTRGPFECLFIFWVLFDGQQQEREEIKPTMR